MSRISILMGLTLMWFSILGQLKVEPSTDRVIIGSTSVAKGQLDVRRITNGAFQAVFADAPSSSVDFSSTYAGLYLANSNQTIKNFSRFNFGDGDAAATASIASKIKNHVNNGGTLEFYTRSENGGSILRRMGISDKGKVYVGEVLAANTMLTVSGRSEFELGINAIEGNPDITFMENGTARAQIRYNINDTDFGFHINNCKVMSVDGGGILKLKGSLSSTQLTCPSDIRLKKNIHSFDRGLEAIQSLNPVSFEYNGNNGILDRSKHIGLIAQEVQKIIPELVEISQDAESKKNYLTVRSSEIQYLLINAIQEQQEMITNQNCQLAKKGEEIIDLQEDIALLKEQMNKIISSMELLKNE